jgi:hypothetical protein
LPLGRVAEEIRARSERIDGRLSRLDRSRPVDRLRGRALILRTFVPLALRAVDLRKVFRGNPVLVLLRMLGGLIRGKRAGDLAREHLNLSRILRVAVLPFEEFHSIDASRLENCKAVFAYEDAEDGTIKTIPACTWGSVYRNDILRKIAAKYGNPRSQAALPVDARASTDKDGRSLPEKDQL